MGEDGFEALCEEHGLTFRDAAGFRDRHLIAALREKAQFPFGR